MRTHRRFFGILTKMMSLVLALCILTFFSGTIVCAKPDSNSHVDEIEGSSTAGTSDPEDPEDFEFNITSNAGSSSLSASLQMLLVLTVLALAPIDHYNDDIIYKNYRGASFCAFCIGNTDESAKSGFGGACFISDTVYHVTGHYTDQYGLCSAV